MGDGGSRPDRPARFRDVFAIGEFRYLWLAQVFSVAGDQLAAVGVAVLVYHRTQSPAWTALVYAMTFLPDLAGGALLAGLADRYPRRLVMVTADVVRALLVAVMALPGQSIALLIVLLIVVQLLASPFSAARNAVLPAVLTGDRYVAGVTITRITVQLGQVLGFAVGAAIVAALGTPVALMVDAGTFVVSAVLVRLGSALHRPASVAGAPQTWWGTVRAGFVLVVADRRLRALVGLACVSGAYVVPEGLAVPYAAEIHAGTGAVGLLMAANPAGMVVGMLLLQRMRPETRVRLMGPLAVATCAVLIPTGLAPVLGAAVALWFLSGVASAYNMITNATFVQNVPDHSRGQAVGLAQASLRVAQGVGIVGSGLLAQLVRPAQVVALAAVVGVVMAVSTATAWSRADSSNSLRSMDETSEIDSSSA
ncbi:MAG TPA: MFS transporter [Pseudonocardiaceae bacterium]|jgi:MFS family permease|nr:MFS transporter [Pseudonocardiaceae bacterium]